MSEICFSTSVIDNIYLAFTEVKKFLADLAQNPKIIANTELTKISAEKLQQSQSISSHEIDSAKLNLQ